MGELWFDARYVDIETGAVFSELDVGPRLAADDGTLRRIGGLLLDSEFEKPDISFRGEAFAERREQIRAWSLEDHQAFGSWVLELVRTDEDDSRTITQRDVRRLSILGLGPSEVGLLSGAGVSSMAEYRNLIGESSGHSPGRFEHWGPDEYLEYARRVEKLAKGMPRREHYDEAAARGWGPTYSGIFRTHGGVSKLNELLWYPDVEAMTPSDMVHWGVRAKRANEGMYLSTPVIEILAGRHRGPGKQKLLKTFKNWRDFTDQVDDIYDAEQQEAETERKEKLAMYDFMIQAKELPSSAAQMSEADLLAYAGKYRVVDALVPMMSHDSKLRFAGYSPGKFKSDLVRTRDYLTAGIIEVTADKFGVFDDIWQLDDGLQHLVVTGDELTKKRAQGAKAKRNQYVRKGFISHGE